MAAEQQRGTCITLAQVASAGRGDGAFGPGWLSSRQAGLWKEGGLAQIHPQEPERVRFTQIHDTSSLKQRKGLLPHNFPLSP